MYKDIYTRMRIWKESDGAEEEAKDKRTAKRNSSFIIVLCRYLCTRSGGQRVATSWKGED